MSCISRKLINMAAKLGNSTSPGRSFLGRKGIQDVDCPIESMQEASPGKNSYIQAVTAADGTPSASVQGQGIRDEKCQTNPSARKQQPRNSVSIPEDVLYYGDFVASRFTALGKAPRNDDERPEDKDVVDLGLDDSRIKMWSLTLATAHRQLCSGASRAIEPQLQIVYFSFFASASCRFNSTSSNGSLNMR